MKKLLLPVFLWASISASAQNALLKSPTTGSVPVADLIELGMVSDGSNVVLLAADKTGVYAIDIADNNAGAAGANTVTNIPNFVSDKLDAASGQTVSSVLDMEVNPISKSVYFLVNATGTKYVLKMEKNGASCSVVNLSNIKFSKLTWGGTFAPNDMAFGNNTLYVSSGSFSLAGELGWIAPPFTHNAAFTKRATTMFKSNWGGQYSTTAPLETLAFGNIGGQNRLMGVTTCAPGFSIDVSKLTGSGVMQVTEDFNVQYGFSENSLYMHHDNNDWLFDLHDNNVYRIGKKFLDGSQVTANKHNANAVKLRDNTGKITTTLTDNEMKLMSTAKIVSMAKWDEYRILMLERGATGALKLAKVSTENPPAGIGSIYANVSALNMYPNPAKGMVNISLPTDVKDAVVNIASMNGTLVMTQIVAGGKTELNIGNLAKGMYSVNVKDASGNTFFGKLTVE